MVEVMNLISVGIPNHPVNGSLEHRLSGNLHVSLGGVTSEQVLVLLELNDVSISSGSACNSVSTGPSHVVHALGIGPEMIGCTLRVGEGRFTKQEDIA
ncbi:desulfurase IscS [Seminavis robusta]|uniref:Desulfurase IscS n=1 Tax=Seminavis robusta TaxID=568900 RepID=A0A9N8ETL6_9STRA|nr:desulfurase IscS [Seminavis robusta]|eukprot:Sro1650_g288700.1 desulfurase IscS (98) ;mRNA; r:11210-11640